MSQAGNYYHIEIAEIVSINPIIPQSWGTFKAGGYPQTPGRKYPAPLFQHSRMIWFLIIGDDIYNTLIRSYGVGALAPINCSCRSSQKMAV